MPQDSPSECPPWVWGLTVDLDNLQDNTVKTSDVSTGTSRHLTPAVCTHMGLLATNKLDQQIQIILACQINNVYLDNLEPAAN